MQDRGGRRPGGTDLELGARAALVRAQDRGGDRPRLTAAIVDAGAGEGIAAGGDASLRRMPLSTVLPDGSYQLLLEELPSVPRNEIRSALRWRVRDRIDRPLEESVVELLEIRRRRRARAASRRRTRSSRDANGCWNRSSACGRWGLGLDAVDLPELCMRNIAVRMPEDREGVAFLHFTDDSGLLTITRQGVLYLIASTSVSCSWTRRRRRRYGRD
ncbi:MAG: hypothetical protein U5K76_01280 [Woeseiaceae bacterium]|nr:hypothetical protein [Woeseiaceae bacterium]